MAFKDGGEQKVGDETVVLEVQRDLEQQGSGLELWREGKESSREGRWADTGWVGGAGGSKQECGRMQGAGLAAGSVGGARTLSGVPCCTRASSPVASESSSESLRSCRPGS